MSYILEALKRADRERRLAAAAREAAAAQIHPPTGGRAPRADPAPPQPAPAEVVGELRQPLVATALPARSPWWTLMAACVVLLALGLWWFGGPNVDPQRPEAAAIGAPLASHTQPPAPSPTSSMPAPNAAGAEPMAPTAPQPTPTAPASQPAFLPPPAPNANTAVQIVPPRPLPPADAPAAAATLPLALKDLPAESRRQLPSLKLSGSIYSPLAANRLLVIDGQVLHEGDRIAPDLVLEQVGPQAAVLRWRQQRIELPY